jgi:hypothetical protein
MIILTIGSADIPVKACNFVGTSCFFESGTKGFSGVINL